MEYSNLGKSGLKVSKLSFGSYMTFAHKLQLPEIQQFMQVAYENGINLFDNAEVYALGKSEVLMGEALKLLNWPRETYLVCSKVFWGGPSPTQIGLHKKHIFEACHSSLKRLNLKYLDFFICHRPDPNTSIEEIVWAMNLLIQQGKILYWGTSEWDARRITEAYRIAYQHHLIPPTIEQFQYNLLVRDRAEKEYLPLYDEFGLGTVTTMPLSCGLLTGKYNMGIPANSRVSELNYFPLEKFIQSEEGKKTIQKIEKLKNVAKDIGGSLAQLSIAWCLKNLNINTVIFGASNIEHLKENLSSLQICERLTIDVMSLIDDILQNKPFLESAPSYEEVKQLA